MRYTVTILLLKGEGYYSEYVLLKNRNRATSNTMSHKISGKYCEVSKVICAKFWISLIHQTNSFQLNFFEELKNK